MERLISLAAGVCPETAPGDFVSAAADAGWPACGIWFDADTWTDAVATDVRRRLDDTGLVALDMEPVFITPDGDRADRIIEAAAIVGARNLLVVSRGAEVAHFTERFAEICDAAAEHGMGCSIEFMAFMSTRSLVEAIAVLDAVGRPNGGVLVDSLHLARTGGTPGDVAGVAAERIAYMQLCDAPSAAPDNLVVEALDERVNLGDGELPLAELLAAAPLATPISLEVRSAALRNTFTDPTDRARHVLDATRSWLGAVS